MSDSPNRMPRPKDAKPTIEDKAVAAKWKREDPRMTPDKFETVAPPGGEITKFRAAFRNINVQRNGRKIISFNVDPQDRSALHVFDDYAGITMVIAVSRMDYASSDNDLVDLLSFDASQED